MPRKGRQRKWKRRRQEEQGNEDNLLGNSLEDDLRLQRLRQHERLVEKQKQESNDRRIDEHDENDAKIEVETPLPSLASQSLPQHWIVRGNTQRWPAFTPEISSLWGLVITQQSPGLSSRQRGRWNHWTASKYLLENIHMEPRASTLYSGKLKWADHLLPNDMYCSGDLTCKHHLHPSARTFDVAQMTDNDNMLSSLPAIATVLQGGWGLYQPATRQMHSRIQTLRWYVLLETVPERQFGPGQHPYTNYLSFSSVNQSMPFEFMKSLKHWAPL